MAHQPENLESRIAPATFVVNSLEATGLGTLSDAIDQANALPGLDVIKFAVKGTVFTDSTLLITDDVVIKAPTKVIIDGQADHQVFNLTGDGFAKFKNLKIMNGFSLGEAGGGIGSNDFDLKLVSCAVTQNQSDVEGGGVAFSNGTLTLRATKISFNTAPNGGGIAVHDGVLKTNGARILNNTAGEQDITAGQGGGIFLADSSAKLVDSRISGNTAASTYDYSGLGGGIFATGSTYSYTMQKQPVVLYGTVVTKNVAESGGGIFYNGDEVNLKLIASIVSGNTGGQIFKYQYTYTYP